MRQKLPNIASNSGRFQDGNPATGTLGTVVTAVWLNDVQDILQSTFEEHKQILALANMQPNPSATNQLSEAIKAYFQSRLTADTGIGSANLAFSAAGAKVLAQQVAQNKLDITNGLNKKVDKTSISDAVDSTSQTTVASSKAAKTAYDKGVEAKSAADAAQRTANQANDNANSRVSKSGDTMTGNLLIKSGGYSSVRTYNNTGESVRWETAPTSENHMAAIVLADTGERVVRRVLVPRKDGTLLLDNDSIVVDNVGKNADQIDSLLTTGNSVASYHNKTGEQLPAGAYSYGTVLSLKSHHAHAQLIFTHANQMYLRNYYSGNSIKPWIRIDGADWQDIRNNPLTLAGSILTFNGQYLGVSVSNNGYGGINIKRQGSAGNWDSRLEALPDKRWKFWTQGAFDVYIPAKAGTVVLDTDGAVDATANTYVKRDAAGDVLGRLFRATYQDETRIQGAIAFRVNNSNDNYTRYCNNPAAIRTWLGLKEGVENFCQKLLATSNLNDVMIPGIYGQNADINATSARNYPEAQSGSLIVSLSAYGVQQEYTTYGSKNKYVRGRLNSAWTAWKRIDGADWSEVRNKPATFTPSTHSHPWSQVTGVPATATRWPNAGEQGYTQSLSDNGWTKLPNGLILQWGWSDSQTVKFPIAFPSKIFMLSHSKTGAGRDTRVANVSSTGFSSFATGDVGRTYYVAIGI
ncbi:MULTISPECIES: pyocin knob domain-containing protein [Glaesserella]|uniref:pyocin knob domain-containing protein n=1 Tax=Glaesserella TaxID=2094023 RepID=UPI001EDCDB98|nr:MULTISPECIES: pyocin knob domain-containing protein [Glaesserella]